MTIARARFEIPARVKTDPILNNYLAQTMEDNVRSGVRHVRAEMLLILAFPTVVRMLSLKSLINVRTNRKPIE